MPNSKRSVPRRCLKRAGRPIRSWLPGARGETRRSRVSPTGDPGARRRAAAKAAVSSERSERISRLAASGDDAEAAFRRTLLAPTLAALALLAGAVGCKPKTEPPRQAPRGIVLDPLAGTREGGGDQTPSAFKHMARLTADAGESAGPDAGLADPLREPDAGPSPPDAGDHHPQLGLSEAQIASIRAPVEPDAEKEANQAVRLGLKHHRKLDMDRAIKAYKRALELWPGSPGANYNMACALSLEGDKAGAIAHLEALVALGEDDTAQDKLAKARTDRDFENMRDDEAFRRLVGYRPVAIDWTQAGEQSTEGAAARLAKQLEGLEIPASLGQAWAPAPPRSTVFVAAGDPAAGKLAERVAELTGPGVEVKRTDKLGTDRPIVVVVVGETSGPTETGGVGSLDDLLGRRLKASTNEVVEVLQLKATGFFSWELTYTDGRRVRRTGRYHHKKKDARLHFSFRQSTETPTADPIRPKVEIEQGRRSTHDIEVLKNALVLDGLTYRAVR